MRSVLRGRVLPLAASAAALGLLAGSGVAVAELPDGRAYELVTPGAAKSGGWVSSNVYNAVSPDGTRVAYGANNPFGDATHGVGGLEEGLSYVASRSDSGWASKFTAGVETPDPTMWEYFYARIWGASPDVSRVFLDVEYKIPGFTSGTYESDAQGTIGLVAAKPGTGSRNPRTVAASSDGSRQIVDAEGTAPLQPIPGNPAMAANSNLLYERSADGTLTLLNVDDNGDVLSTSGARFASRLGARVTARYPASADGSRVFFLSARPGDTVSPTFANRGLYVRVDGAHTIELSESQTPTPRPADAAVLFAGASEDGTRAYFTSTAALTADAVGAGPFLYEYELQAGASSGDLRLIAGNDHPVSTRHPTPQGAGREDNVAQVVVSDDGSRVYYSSLDDGGSIYAYDTASGATRLVAQDTRGTRLQVRFGGGQGSYGSGADVSADGRYLVFLASAALTGGDNEDQQVYRYDAETGDLALISAGPAAPTSFSSELNSHPRVAMNMPNESNLISDDGRYVFFETAAALVGSDTNDQVDVYRWTPDGGVALISDGRGSEDAYVLGASADGSTVFIGTFNDLLRKQDGDDLYDIYAVRIGGGFPDPVDVTPCTGDACQGPSKPAPFLPLPTTTVFTGGGNAEDPDVPDSRFTVNKVTAAQKRSLARKGRATIVVKTTDDGWVNATLSAKLGRRWVRSSSQTKGLRRAGTVKVQVQLSRRVRRYLAKRRGAVPVRVDVTYSAADETKRAQFSIRRAAAKSRGGR